MGDVDDVVEHLAELIERPLVLYDTDLNVVTYSAHAGDVDEARRLTILSRRGTARAREMMRAHNAASSTEPVRLPARDGRAERVVVAVRHEGYAHGYLVYVEPGAPRVVPGPVRDLLDRYVPELGRLLAVRDLDGRGSRLRLRVLVSDLLSDDPARRDSAAHGLMDDELLPVRPEYTGLVLVGPGGPGPSSVHRRVLEAGLVALTRVTREPLAGAVVGGEAVAVLAGPSDRAPRLSGRSGVRVGIGSGVPELAGVVSSVRQARVAARGALLDPGHYGTTVAWGDLGLDRLLLRLPLEQLGVDDLPPSVRRLIAPGSGPDLPATVEAYLDCGADAQATALRLQIHRSTLYYRLDRAREVAGVDLRDGAVRRELHTGLRVARLAGLVP